MYVGNYFDGNVLFKYPSTNKRYVNAVSTHCLDTMEYTCDQRMTFLLSKVRNCLVGDDNFKVMFTELSYS